MANNKVVLNDGTTLIDLTDTTATADKVALGKTFYGANGVKTTGTLNTDQFVKKVDNRDPDTNGNVQVTRELTQAEYDALSSAEKNNGVTYYITDSQSSSLSASNISYVNATSGLSATNVQNAIDEAVQKIKDHPILFGAWTATSSSVLHSKMSESIFLDKGIYIINLAVPVVSANGAWGIYSNGAYINDFYMSGGSGSNGITFVEIENDNTEVYIAVTSSTSITYTYRERGGIRAIKIA